MTFTTRRADGTLELRQHIPHTITATGAAWEARRMDGSLMVRSYLSADDCAKTAASMTQPATR